MSNLGTPRSRHLQVVSDNDDAETPLRNPIIQTIKTFEHLASLPRQDWLYAHHYLRGSVSATIADGGTGKSTLVIAEAIAMATGRNLLGVVVPKPLSVMYLNLEESAEQIARRIAAVCEQHGIDPVAELTDCLEFQSGLDNPVIVAKMERNAIVTDEDIHDAFDFGGFDVVIVDPFNRCHAVPENDNTAVAAVVNVWASVAARHCMAVELVHHSRKPPFGGQAEIGASDARGASSFIDAVRSARVLNRMTEAEGQAAKIDDYRDYIRLDYAKSNYAKAQDSATWFKKISVPIANGEAVGAVVPWKYPGVFDDVTTAHLTRVRLMAANGDYRADPQSPDWIGRAVAEVMELDADDDKAKIKSILRTWFKNGALVTVERKDKKGMVRLFVAPGDQ